MNHMSINTQIQHASSIVQNTNISQGCFFCTFKFYHE